MRRLLEEFIYDKDTDYIVTFNKPEKKEDFLEMISIALTCLGECKEIDSKNIKCFKLSAFRLIYCNPHHVSYIQEYPVPGKEDTIL